MFGNCVVSAELGQIMMEEKPFQCLVTCAMYLFYIVLPCNASESSCSVQNEVLVDDGYCMLELGLVLACLSSSALATYRGVLSQNTAVLLAQNLR